MFLLDFFTGKCTVYGNKLVYIIKEASDIVIIKINRIEGENYGEKAIAHVERSFKGTVQSDSIELPFVYRSWPIGKGSFMENTGSLPLSFNIGDRYVALIQKWHRSLNPYAAETQYEVINYPKATLFKIKNENDSRLLEKERLLTIANISDISVQIDSLVSMTKNNKNEIRVDAIEALIDLKAEKAVEAFISLLRSDTDVQVRFSAAHRLGFLHSDSIVSSLLECFKKEKSNLVKFGIIGSLGMQKSAKAAPILLGNYEMEGYDIQNNILEAVSRCADSTVAPILLHLFSIDKDNQHRHIMAQTIASLHTPETDRFSSDLLANDNTYWFKSAVITGWTESGYTKGYDQIVKWAWVLCASGDQNSNIGPKVPGLMFTVLVAVEKLRTPGQILSTLKEFANCNDSGILQNALGILKEQLNKKIPPELREKIEEEIKTFPSN